MLTWLNLYPRIVNSKRVLPREENVKQIEQWLGSVKMLTAFPFRLFRRRKWLSVLLIFLLGLTLSGWTVESNAVRIPILGFHDIIDAQNPAERPPHRLTFETDYTKQHLATLLESLVQENYWFLTAQDLYLYFIEKSKPIPPEHLGQKPIMLTFDDGYKGVHSNGLPILENLESIYGKKVKFVLFINPRYLGVDNGGDFLPHTSCDDLREGYRKGYYDIQSHGFNHKNLTKLQGKDLDFELAEAKLALRKCLSKLDRNKTVAAHIAYPYGSSNKQVEKVLPKYYLTGFLYDDNFLQVNWLRNRYQISRVPVNKETSVKKLLTLARKASTLRKKKWW